MKKGITILFVFVLAFGTLVSAKQKTRKPNPDRAFMIAASTGGMFQVEAGKLAVQRAGSEEVKKFGQQMIDDHSKADRELTQLAQTKGITLPQNLTREERVDLDMLSKKTGKEFDQAYMSLMVRDHSKDIGEFRKEAQSGKDPDVKAWASKTLTTVESHHNMATDISHRH